MTYRAPVSDILQTMAHVGGLADGLYPDLADDAAGSILEEAGRMAESVLLPLDRTGDRQGAVLKDGHVVTTPGWPEAYRQWREGGWNGVAAPSDFGGMGLPWLLQTGCMELWSSANASFALGPVLTIGAIEALGSHGSAALQQMYLPKLVSGEWTGTMNLTEPQAGSDVGALKTRAEPAADGTYRITGQKIFITYGDHDMTDNIVHLVLARLPDAPAGSRGISLFLVPKFLPGPDGALGAANDLFCARLEHKLGMHASPTCTMVFGDKGGATGWLIGQENKGLACMFTMMNNARLSIAIQGVAAAERATQEALAYARDRRQGRAANAKAGETSPIVEHPDVARMLMTMKAQTAAARAICYLTAACLDGATRLTEPAAKARTAARAALLTPLAKAFATDIGNEVASMGVQVHGGMGFMEETGAAQIMRDVRIAAIYEGTNGIQAIDLATRKLTLDDGAVMAAEIADMRAVVASLRTSNAQGFGKSAARLEDSIDALERAAAFIAERLTAQPVQALLGATGFLRLFGLARGGTALAGLALKSGEADRATLCRFFAEQLVPASDGLARAIVEGAEALDGTAALLSAEA